MSTDIWYRKPQYTPVDNPVGDEHVHVTWAGPINTKLYGDELQELCRSTRNNILRMRSTMKLDPCLEYGIEHWHPDCRPTSSEAYRVTAPTKNNTSWHDPSVMFTSYGSLSSLTSTVSGDTSSVAPGTAATNFCYLCSTLEEHQKHQLRYKPPQKYFRPRKLKVAYMAPPPKTKVKKSKPEVPAEVLFKLVVVTGNIPQAGTQADVYITLHGKHNSAPRIQLKKGRGSSKFCFVRGSTETIYYKGPKLGNLTFITIEHNGLMKKDGWYLDYIEVTNMLTEQSWMFVCKNWLSLHHSDFCIKRDLEASLRERLVRELDVTVVTSTKRLAGTDAKVYLTLNGSKGSSPKIHLPESKDNRHFERGNEDHFQLRVKDIGELKTIRIEHDGSGIAPGWHLNKIIIRDVNDPRYTYHFIYDGWLARSSGSGTLWRIIRAQTGLDKEVATGREIKYEVTVRTGDVFGAGTDANVFIQFVGAKGTTKKLKIDDARNNFEKGMCETFELHGIDVGPLIRIVVSHDNTSPGAGWFLEDVTVKRYLSREEQKDRLKRMKKFHRQNTVLKKKRLAEKMNKADRKNENIDSSDSDDSESSDDDTSDDDRKSMRRSRRKSKDPDELFASETFDRDGNCLRVPEYEWYFFSCKQWLAKDEGDGQVSRELKVNKKETFFKER